MSTLYAVIILVLNFAASYLVATIIAEHFKKKSKKDLDKYFLVVIQSELDVNWIIGVNNFKEFKETLTKRMDNAESEDEYNFYEYLLENIKDPSKRTLG